MSIEQGFRLKKKPSTQANRVFITSFFLTFIILTVAAGVFIYVMLMPVTHHLPSTYDFQHADWMKYISPGAEKVALMNFTQIFLKTGNTSLFPSNRLLVLYNFTTELNILETEFSITALYLNPNQDEEDLALNIIRPTPNLYLAFEDELKEKGEIEVTYQNYTITQVTGHVVNEPALAPDPSPEYVKSYIALDNGYLLYAEGTLGLELIEHSLETAENPSQFFQQERVKASLYLLLSTTNDELGVSYSTFPYPVEDVRSTSTSIYYEDKGVVTHYVFSFDNASTAIKNSEKIKTANLAARDLTVIDNYIVVNMKKAEGNVLIRELRSL